MPALTPQFLVDIETRMQVITEREYVGLTSSLWWQKVAKTRPSTGRKDIISWLLSTAQIRDQEVMGGKITFDDLVARYMEIENRFAGAGLKLRRAQLEDTDGGGMDLAGQWSADIGAYMAYWPQKLVSNLLKAGESTVGYDTKNFFATDHPLNPFDVGLGTFRNIFTGAASGSYPGACPIDDSVTTDVALQNLAKIMGYIASIKMPNGEDPRYLRPKMILAPPRLFPRAVQLTNAKFIAQAASAGGGSGDVEALIAALGFATPTMADEFAGYESDKTFFVVAEQKSTTQLGGIVYSEREAFKINYYGVMQDAELDRKDELEWHCRGRNVAAPGHPYLIFKCKAT